MITRFSTLLLLGCLVASGCTPSRGRVVVRRGEVKVVENCRVRVENVFENEAKPFAGLEVACDVATGPNWWGAGKEPLAFTLSTGDCALLQARFYCATAVDVGKSVTLEPMFRFEGGNVLTREH